MQHPFIQKCTAGILMAIFVLCNTPTSALHTLFADHKDQTTSLQYTHATSQISATGIDCHCNSNVVTAPFLPQLQQHVLPLAEKHQHFSEAIVARVATGDHFRLSLRGPPVRI